MNVVGKVGSLISQGVYSVATPFHPFGGAVDVIVVQQQDGTFRTTPWYVQFGKFQGVLKGVEKIVRISVNGIEADFHMYLDNSGEAYFLKEVSSGESSVRKEDSKEGGSLDGAQKDATDDEKSNFGGLERTESDSGRLYYEFEDDQLSLEGSMDNLDLDDHNLESHILNSEVVLVSVDGHILTAPISSIERDIDDDVQLSTPKFHLGPGQEADFFEDSADFTTSDEAWTGNLNMLSTSSDVASKESRDADTAVKDNPCQVEENENAVKHERESGAETNTEAGSMNTRKDDIFKSCLDIAALANHDTFASCLDIPALANHNTNSLSVISENASLLPASEDGDVNKGSLRNSEDLFHSSPSLPIDVVYSNLPDEVELTSECNNSVGHIDSESSSVSCSVHDKEAELEANDLIGENAVASDINSDNTSPSNVTHNAELDENVDDSLTAEQCSLPGSEDTTELPSTPSGRRWRLWPIPFRRVKILEHTSSTSTIDKIIVDSLSVSQHQPTETTPTSTSGNDNKQFLRINVPTNEQIASLNLKEGQNMVTFSFCTRVLGMQQVDAHIYLWKWNARIVISDVDGTITKSDVLGQFMPLFGKDWTQSGVARLFCAIKENGYQLLFLSARAIVQAYLTRSFLNNIKQDGKALPTGPVVISPNGLFPSLFREVIRRAPQEFKIACLEDIKALFPSDYNPFYAGFGNRDTDELSYRKIGIPKGKIFIINPKGEVAISQHRIDVKSYTSLHTLVNDMFPPTSMVEQEDFNSWNFWRMPLPDID